MDSDKDMYMGRKGSMNYTRVEEQSTLDASNDDEQKKKTVDSVLISISVPPPGSGVNEFCSLSKSSSTKKALSPRVKRRNRVALATAAWAAAKRWKMTMNTYFTIILRIPLKGLRTVRDGYVRSLANIAGNLNSSTACVVMPYGAGHSPLEQTPAAWRTESERYRCQLQEQSDCLSESFRQSLREPRVSRSYRTSEDRMKVIVKIVVVAD
ncbi:hypothetical protein R1sor_013017 [Riccia sorocarpa]|uniref:Uncharacterized protein n=1 Tax=Riccia sorocarpa TaxID=122646 RepID=A0ABD3H5W5_9MARC